MTPARGDRLGGLTVLGIDPGLAVTGYGLILARGDDYQALDFGAIAPPARLTHSQRLQHIFEGLTEVIRSSHPDEVAVEDFFVGYARAAVAVGEARGVALLATAQAGLPVSLYKPLEVKQFVTSYGRGSKEQVKEMVRTLLGLEEPPQPADAADALAVAICHCLRRGAAATLDPRSPTRRVGAGRRP